MLSDDFESVLIWGDTLENYSGRGPTKDCIMKPDVIAPGSQIISCLTQTPQDKYVQSGKFKIVDQYYTVMSGTSMSTPIVSGAVALLLEKHPNLTPDQVKLLIKNSSTDMYYPQNQQGWGLLNVDKLIGKEIFHGK